MSDELFDFENLLNTLKNITPSQISDSEETIQDEVEYLKGESERAIQFEKLKELKTKNKLLKQTLKVEKKNTRLREYYAKRIFAITCFWSLLIFVILFFYGFANYTCFYISDKVVITLITSTTINFFGFFFLVVKYLFYVRQTKEDINSKSISQ